MFLLLFIHLIKKNSLLPFIPFSTLNMWPKKELREDKRLQILESDNFDILISPLSNNEETCFESDDNEKMSNENM